MKIIFALLSFLLVATGASRGQTSERYIEVVGSAEMEVVPDVIVLWVSLREYDVNKQKVALEEIEKKFFAAVDKSGIDRKKISLSDAVAGSLTPRRRDREFYAATTFSVTLSTTNEIQTLMNNLADVKPERVSISKLDRTDMESLKLEVKVQALKASERKADALLKAVEAKRGKILQIRETADPEGWSMTPGFANFSFTPSNADRPGDGIQFEKINLHYSVTTRFQIE